VRSPRDRNRQRRARKGQEFFTCVRLQRHEWSESDQTGTGIFCNMSAGDENRLSMVFHSSTVRELSPLGGEQKLSLLDKKVKSLSTFDRKIQVLELSAKG
jgi:hypothetical protein